MGAGVAKTLDSLIGTVIADRFRVLEPIAQGGMANVFLAEQEALGRQVALKVLGTHDRPLRPGFAERFAREAATAARLAHPNVVTIFDYGVLPEENLYFLAMEFVEGDTLARIVQRDGPLESGRAAPIFLQVARALRAAHRHGLVHRDLKPGNILITTGEDGEDCAKVVDFGLVKDLAEMNANEEGVYLGSPRYMAPEQIQPGLPLDGRIDIYGFGATLYTALVGHPPYQARTTLETLLMHMEAPIPVVERDDGAPIDDELCAITRRCLAKNPEARFDSMQDIIDHLKVVILGPDHGDVTDYRLRLSSGPPSGLRRKIESAPFFDSDPPLAWSWARPSLAPDAPARAEASPEPAPTPEPIAPLHAFDDLLDETKPVPPEVSAPTIPAPANLPADLLSPRTSAANDANDANDARRPETERPDAPTALTTVYVRQSPSPLWWLVVAVAIALTGLGSYLAGVRTGQGAQPQLQVER